MYFGLEKKRPDDEFLVLTAARYVETREKNNRTGNDEFLCMLIFGMMSFRPTKGTNGNRTRNAILTRVVQKVCAFTRTLSVHFSVVLCGVVDLPSFLLLDHIRKV